MGGIRPRNAKRPDDYTGPWFDNKWYLNGKETPLAEIKKVYPNIDARRKGGFNLSKALPTPQNLKGFKVPNPKDALPDLDIPNWFDEAFRELLNELLKALASEITSKLVKTWRKSLPDSASITLGFISLSWDNIDKNVVGGVEKAIKNPPNNKDGVKSLVLALAPDSVSLSGSLSIPVIDLGVGGSATWNVDRFVNDFEDIIGEFL